MDAPDADGDPREPGLALATEETPDREIARTEVRQAFFRALEELSPEHRTALMLREVEGRSYREIAEAMGCRVGTVMSRLFYARRLIQKRLEHLEERP